MKSRSFFFSAETLGLPPYARLRCLLPLGNDDLAVGTDYGLVLYQKGSFQAFPFPAGARQKSRCVESMALHEGILYVATTRNWYTWDLTGEVVGKGFPTDYKGEFDELRVVFSTPDGLLKAWRSHLEGAQGPEDCLCFALSPTGEVYAGSRSGFVCRLGDFEIRKFEEEGYASPVRHLAFAHDTLWVAAAGALHRFRTGGWEAQPGEPYALSVDPLGRLWSAHSNGIRCSPDGDWPTPAGEGFAIERPWSLAHTSSRTWVGVLGGLYSLESSS